jgi:hypothetical protein
LVAQLHCLSSDLLEKCVMLEIVDSSPRTVASLHNDQGAIKIRVCFRAQSTRITQRRVDKTIVVDAIARRITGWLVVRTQPCNDLEIRRIVHFQAEQNGVLWSGVGICLSCPNRVVNMPSPPSLPLTILQVQEVSPIRMDILAER